MIPRWPYEDAHERAREQFRALDPEARLARMRQAGVIGLTPQLGDKVRVLGPLNDWRYGIVVGESRDAEPRVCVVHKPSSGTAQLMSLSQLANGYGVGLVQRAAPGTELHVVQRALELLGSSIDLEGFDVAEQVREPAVEETVQSLLAERGLHAESVILTGDREWDEARATYREARHET